MLGNVNRVLCRRAWSLTLHCVVAGMPTACAMLSCIASLLRWCCQLRTIRPGVPRLTRRPLPSWHSASPFTRWQRLCTPRCVRLCPMAAARSPCSRWRLHKRRVNRRAQTRTPSWTTRSLRVSKMSVAPLRRVPCPLVLAHSHSTPTCALCVWVCLWVCCRLMYVHQSQLQVMHTVRQAAADALMSSAAVVSLCRATECEIRVLESRSDEAAARWFMGKSLVSSMLRLLYRCCQVRASSCSILPW